MQRIDPRRPDPQQMSRHINDCQNSHPWVMAPVFIHTLRHELSRRRQDFIGDDTNGKSYPCPVMVAHTDLTIDMRSGSTLMRECPPHDVQRLML